MSLKKYHFQPKDGNKRAVLVDGVRSPFVKSFGVFASEDALSVFSRVVDGLLRRLPLDPIEIDEIIAGAVIPQTKNPAVARDTILNLGLPRHIHGVTVNRACTSSLQAASDAAAKIQSGHPHLILVGGVEILSDVPIVYSREARQFLTKFSRARSPAEKLSAIKRFSAKSFLPNPPALAEPMTGLTMGQHAEIMAQKNGISREDQDQFAAASHQKSAQALDRGILAEEIVTLWPAAKKEPAVCQDNMIRAETSAEKIKHLKPVFDRKYGTITAANSSPLTDGASIGLIADEARAKSLGLSAKVLIRDYVYIGCDPDDQLLIGPAIAVPLLLKRCGLTLGDIDRFEIHEAFAAQVLSCLRSMESKDFNEKWFGKSKAFGSVDPAKLNVNGGAIAIGHPFGATGMRLISSMANELIRSDLNLGVIAICAAGGMAGAMLVERV